MDMEQKLSIFIKPSLSMYSGHPILVDYNELYATQFPTEALQPICHTLTELDFAGLNVNLLTFILRHVKNVDILDVDPEMYSDAMAKLKNYPVHGMELKPTMKMKLWWPVSRAAPLEFGQTRVSNQTLLHFKIENNQHYEATASTYPMLKEIVFHETQCDPAIIKVISEKHPCLIPTSKTSRV